VGGLVDAIDDGVTGVLVPPRDPAALREAVLGLLADPERRALLGSEARARAVASRPGGLLESVYREASR
jgi:type III pantothenate kinase